MDLLLEAVEFFSKDPELCRVSCSLIMGVLEEGKRKEGGDKFLSLVSDLISSLPDPFSTVFGRWTLNPAFCEAWSRYAWKKVVFLNSIAGWPKSYSWIQSPWGQRMSWLQFKLFAVCTHGNHWPRLTRGLKRSTKEKSKSWRKVLGSSSSPLTTSTTGLLSRKKRKKLVY